VLIVVLTRELKLIIRPLGTQVLWQPRRSHVKLYEILCSNLFGIRYSSGKNSQESMHGKQNFTQRLWNDWKNVEIEHWRLLRKIVRVPYPEKNILSKTITNHMVWQNPNILNLAKCLWFFQSQRTKFWSKKWTGNCSRYFIKIITYHNFNLKTATSVATYFHCAINSKCLRRPPFSVEDSCHPIETLGCKDKNSGTIFTLC